MKNIFLYIILIFGLISTQSTSLAAQAGETTKSYQSEPLRPSRLDKANWSKITKGVNYTPQKPKEQKPINMPDIDMPDIDIEPPPATAFEVFAQILLWGIVALVVGLIIFRVVTMGWGKNVRIKPQGEFSLEEVEENLLESDLDRFLREALSKSDYRLAIRVYFLSIVKEMALREMIHWKKDKTNGNYLSELYQKPLYEPFRRIIRIFEYARYSEMEFGKSHFEQVQPEFKQLLSKVSS